MERMSIVNYSNAFFGAFFGFWCKSIFDPLISLHVDVFITTLLTIFILLSISLHVAGLWRCRDIYYTSPIGWAARRSIINVFSVIIFISTMNILVRCYGPVLLFPATFGQLLYLWWVSFAFLTLTLTRPEEG